MLDRVVLSQLVCLSLLVAVAAVVLAGCVPVPPSASVVSASAPPPRIITLSIKERIAVVPGPEASEGFDAIGCTTRVLRDHFGGIRIFDPKKASAEGLPSFARTGQPLAERLPSQHLSQSLIDQWLRLVALVNAYTWGSGRSYVKLRLPDLTNSATSELIEVDTAGLAGIGGWGVAFVFMSPTESLACQKAGELLLHAIARAN